jgi:hypothetical protein
MRAFVCPRCGQLIFFDNTVCLRCDTAVAIDPARRDVVALAEGQARCANAAIAACNWLAEGEGELCRSCRLTRTRPNDDDHEALAALVIAESAKRRLVFQMLGLGIELTPRDEASGTGVAFDLLSSSRRPVTTGHAGGIITLDLAESDDVHREQVRQKMREPYRTVLGHFRHEIGHYLFTVLVGDQDLAEARQRFGDERQDYQAALDRHYAEGAPAGWERDHISEYATMHPAEDWAETVAHYLHIRGTLETAAAYRLRVEGPSVAATDDYAADPVSLQASSIEAIIDTWLPLSYALNAVNRSMGADDLYPFVLPAAVIDKLGFVHRMVGRRGAVAVT